MNLTVDSAAPVLALLKEKKLCIDPQYRVECKQLAGNMGIRRHYFGRQGMTIDQVGEQLWCAGLLPARPMPNEVLSLLDHVFTTAPKARARKRATCADISTTEKRLANYRNRPYDCPGCGDVAYHSGFNWQGRCECGESYSCRHAALLLSTIDAANGSAVAPF